MAFAILRAEKLKTIGNIGGSLAHNYRSIETPNADPFKTPDNFHSLPNAQAVKNAIVERLPEKRRSDAVLCIEYMITASPEWDGWNDERQKEYFKQAQEWLEQQHGKQNVVSISIHRDETTPHLIAYVVPLDQETGRLNAKKFLGGRAKLSALQSDFSKKVKNLGLERGVEGSKAQHTRVKDYYAKVNEPIPQLKPIDRPKAGLFETTAQYGNKVVDSVLEQIKPQWESMAQLAKEVKTARKELSDARKTLLELQNRAKPYLDAIVCLGAKERLILNGQVQEISDQLVSKRLEAEEQQRAKIEQARIERENEEKAKEAKKHQDIQNMTPEQRKLVRNENDQIISKFYRNIDDLAVELYNRATPPNQRVKQLFDHYKLSDMEEVKPFKDVAKNQILKNPELRERLIKAREMIDTIDQINSVEKLKQPEISQENIKKPTQDKGR